MSNLPKIIGLTGKAGAGKDTVASRLAKNYGYQRFAWASGLKRMLEVIGFPEPASRDLKETVIPEFGVSYRHLAQTLGTEWGRAMHPDFWLKIGLKSCKQVMDDGGYVVVSDVRFENEAKAIREAGGLVLHISGRQVDLAGQTSSHLSEKGVTFVPLQDQLLDNQADGMGSIDAQLKLILDNYGHSRQRS